MEINYFDVAIGSIVILLGLKGLLNGFSKEVFGMVGIVGGIFVASHVGGIIGKFLNDTLFRFDSTTSTNIIGFIFAMGIFWGLMIALGSGFKRLSTLSGLGPLDRALGFIVGSSKYFFILSMITYALFSLASIREHFEVKLHSSFLFQPMVATGNFILHIEAENLPNFQIDQNQSDFNGSNDSNNTSKTQVN